MLIKHLETFERVYKKIDHVLKNDEKIDNVCKNFKREFEKMQNKYSNELNKHLKNAKCA